MNGAERSQTVGSHRQRGSNRLAWVLVALLGSLLLVTLKPSIPLDVSISWIPKGAGTGTTAGRTDRSDPSSVPGKERLDANDETVYQPLRRPHRRGLVSSGT